jgi:transposase
MSKFRLYPTAAQEEVLLTYCGHARFVWNLAVEQLNYSTRDRRMPSFAEQSRQLTEARRANPWMIEIPTVVGQQALRDFRQACANWRIGTHKRPRWRKRGRDEGFRVTADHGTLKVEQINKRWSRAWVPRIGWIKFRRSRVVPAAKSFRVTRDPAGHWHIAFAVIPDPISAPENHEVAGVDCGVAATLAYSDGTMLQAPRPTPVKHAARQLARCKHNSNRRRKAKIRLARIYARNADRRRDFIGAQPADTPITPM